ncbi:MAG: ribosomal-protein-alanine N-acetyltransferase [Pseudohongiellaceae bacterium]|jgi:ribosomal-protein-alanine N-acetyltransferase
MSDDPEQRLQLELLAPQQLLALIDGAEQFEQAFGYSADEGLRDFIVSDDVPDEFIEVLQDAGQADPWMFGFGIIDIARQSVIGTCGFKGPPDIGGMVEIAYAIVPSCEGQGFATEATAALVAFAQEEPDVQLLRAHTLPVANASTHVLRKNGFALIGEVEDPDDGPVWRWERAP